MLGSLEHKRREALACQFHHLREVVILHGPVLAVFGVEEPMAHKELEGLPSDWVRPCYARLETATGTNQTTDGPDVDAWPEI